MRKHADLCSCFRLQQDMLRQHRRMTYLPCIEISLSRRQLKPPASRKDHRKGKINSCFAVIVPFEIFLHSLLEIELWGRLVSTVSQVPSDHTNLYRQLNTTSSDFDQPGKRPFCF
jgi:hypothetical protein